MPMQLLKDDPEHSIIPEKLRSAVERYVRAGQSEEFMFDVAETLRRFTERRDGASFEAYVQDVIVSLSTDRDGIDLF